MSSAEQRQQYYDRAKVASAVLAVPSLIVALSLAKYAEQHPEAGELVEIASSFSFACFVFFTLYAALKAPPTPSPGHQ